MEKVDEIISGTTPEKKDEGKPFKVFNTKEEYEQKIKEKVANKIKENESLKEQLTQKEIDEKEFIEMKDKISKFESEQKINNYKNTISKAGLSISDEQLNLLINGNFDISSDDKLIKKIKEVFPSTINIKKDSTIKNNQNPNVKTINGTDYIVGTNTKNKGEN